jgi:uncharacterized protein YoxC
VSDDAVQRGRDARTWVERIGARVPGFEGYLERELRREVDQMLRAQLAARLDGARGRLAEYLRRLPLSATAEIGRLTALDTGLDAAANRLRHAGSGYAGLFDAVKVKEDELDALYEFDNKMLESVNEVASDVDKVASAITAGEGIVEAITDLVRTVDQANQTFGHREEAILQASTQETL